MGWVFWFSCTVLLPGLGVLCWCVAGWAGWWLGLGW